MKPEQRTTDHFCAKATPDGVSITRLVEGERRFVELMTYEDAVERLNTGVYDERGYEGCAIHGAVSVGVSLGYFDFTDQHHVTMWRWLIAATFINEMARANGVEFVDGVPAAIYRNETASMTIYPAVVRLAMANHIEGELIKQCGVADGTGAAISTYIAMMDSDAGELTQSGRELLTMMFDGFIDALNDEPEAQVLH
ncbi:hypothetical protein [Escherichia coli]|uniref:hypothetical protein n=1 Tax=Escherichia coli TaxID=562 RepID=UPI00287A0573|nr:hypothetical protein [Escherichia coli]MDS1617159.1 hypothetical protein [Escherichia coli]